MWLIPADFYRRPLTKEEREAPLITGNVVDRQGHPVRDAKVDLINPQNKLLIATTTTDRSGFYSFLGRLEDGEYEVKVSYHTVPHVQKVLVSKGQLSQLDFKI
jgi:hypothetical protein